MRAFRSTLVVLLAVVSASAVAPRAQASSDVVLEETTRQIGVLDDIRSELEGRRSVVVSARAVENAAATTWLGRDQAVLVVPRMLRTIEVVESLAVRFGLVEGGRVDEIALSIVERMEPGDGRVRALDGRLADLDRRLADLERLTTAADRQTAEALTESLRPEETDPVGRWRHLVERHFPAELVEDALDVIRCESGGDPEARNRRSGASGLFQFMRSTWRIASRAVGMRGASPYDPVANVAAAAWLVAESEAGGVGRWAHWSCRP